MQRAPGLGFSKDRRILKRRDFLRVQTGGKRFRTKDLVLLVKSSASNQGRVGFTVSRKVGNAVVRNRMRRRLREITRHNFKLVCSQYDYVVIALPSSARKDFATLQKDFLWLLRSTKRWVSASSSG